MALFEQAPGFMAILSGPGHVFEFANPSYQGLIGHRDVVGQTVAEALPEVVEQGFVDLLDRVFTSGDPFVGRSMPVRFQATPGGEVDERFVDFVFQPIRDADGRVTGIFVQGSDVTDAVHLAAARAQDAAEARGLLAELESLYQAAPVALTALRRDADGQYRYHRSNDAHARLHGTTAEALAGRLLGDTVPPDFAAHLAALFDRVVGSGETLLNVDLEGETTGVGETRHWVANYYPISDLRSGERAVGVAALDVTAQRRAEEALRASAARATYVSALTDALRLCSDAAAIQATAARLLGEHLGASRAFYAETDAGHAHAVVVGEYLDGMPSVAGRYALSTFGPALLDTLRAGDPVVLDDVARAPLLGETERALFARLGMASFVAVGLRKDGHMPGIVAAHFEQPHAWTEEEIEAVAETAERTWVALSTARAEAALREREARYRALFTSIDEGYCLCEMVVGDDGEAIDYRFLDVNPLFETMTGLAGAVGHTARALVPGLERVWVDTYARVAFGGERLRFEQGSEAMGRIFNIFATPVEPHGRFALVFTDVTERRRAEAALHESESNLRLALEGGEMGVWSWDLATGAVAADARVRAMWGFPPEADLSFRDFFRHIHPDDLPVLRAEVERARATRGVYTTEFRVVVPEALGGGVRWLAGPARAVGTGEGGTGDGAAGDGAATRLVGVNFDITERRQAEQALREGELRFRNMADHSPAMVWVTEADGACSYLNARWYAFTGQTPETALGMGWLSAVHPDDAEAAGHAFAAANLRQESFAIEYRLRRHDGVYRWAIDAAAPRFGTSAEAPPGEEAADPAAGPAAGRFLGYIGSVIDIDDQKAAERQLREANETLEARVAERTAELREANVQLEQRNRELHDFAYVASHDLQEPLRKIQSFASLLAAEHVDALGEEARHYLSRMQSAAGRMSELIRDLLALSRVATSQGRLERVDLDAALDAVLGDLDVRIAQSGGTVEAGGLGVVVADPLQMRQLLQNLVGNALKFYREGAAPRVRVRTERRDRAVVLHVEDDGVGFDARHAERIFSPFQRLHPRTTYEGTGMGLAIVRRIAERHGGTAEATSAPGQGAHFTVTIPQV